MKKILVVDDDSLVRDLLCEILTEEGYSASGVSNGIEALEKLKKAGGGFNLVISDIEMPVMTGIELAREMRSISSVPLILMSGNIYTKEESIALADYFLLKPFEFNDLLSIVERALGE